VVFVYLNEYFSELRRLDSGGETSPKATFLATTLGLRRLFNLLIEAISGPKSFFCSFPKKITNKIDKIFLNSRRSPPKAKSLFSANKILTPQVSISCEKSLNDCGFLHGGLRSLDEE
jgi:hypothetical protein